MLKYIQQRAKVLDEDFDELALLHIMEGVLRRLAKTKYRQTFVLRGGMMSRIWFLPGKWVPNDIDFMVKMPQSPQTIHQCFMEILTQQIDDGVIFDLTQLNSASIWAEAKHPGVRLFVPASINHTQQIRLQIDISFADPIAPPPFYWDYPTVIPELGVNVKTIHPETSVGWKFFGLFERTQDRWRTKDLFGFYWMLKNLKLEMQYVMDSICETFAWRGISLTIAGRFFEGNFATSKRSHQRWRSFCRQHPSFHLPENPETIVGEISTLLKPFFDKILLEGHSPISVKYDQTVTNEICSTLDRKFPTIEHIDEVLEAIHSRDEFKVYQRGNYKIIDYSTGYKYSFILPSKAINLKMAHIYALRRECRGLIFNKEGYLISRKYHKFFSIGEREESQLSHIDWSTDCLILEKLDGTLAVPVIWYNNIVWTTRKGPSSIANQCADFIQSHPGNYQAVISELLHNHWTPLFEWCSRKHRIIIDYPESQLVLTAIRNNYTGDYLDYASMLELTEKYNIPCIRHFGTLSGAEEAKAFIDQVEQKETLGEGYILRFQDSRMYKVKNQHYRKLHTILTHPNNERFLWQAIVANEMAALLDSLPAKEKTEIAAFTEQLSTAIEKRIQWLNTLVVNAKNHIYQKTDNDREAKKLFATDYVKSLNSIEAKLAYIAWKEQDTKKVVLDYIHKKVKTQKSLESIRSFIYDLKLND